MENKIIVSVCHDGIEFDNIELCDGCIADRSRLLDIVQGYLDTNYDLDISVDVEREDDIPDVSFRIIKDHDKWKMQFHSARHRGVTVFIYNVALDIIKNNDNVCLDSRSGYEMFYTCIREKPCGGLKHPLMDKNFSKNAKNMVDLLEMVKELKKVAEMHDNNSDNGVYVSHSMDMSFSVMTSMEKFDSLAKQYPDFDIIVRSMHCCK